MSKKTHPALIGGFVLGALVLALVAIILLAGGDLWQQKKRSIMYFKDSVYGLQIGAPVVFRGVTIGAVKNIGFAFDPGSKAFYIPVEIEMLSASAADLSGNPIDVSTQVSGSDFIARGLRAQLATQSLLTGQLYVDLDFHPDTPATKLSSSAQILPEIPTIPTSVQQIKQRLDKLDFEKLFLDISSMASALRNKAESRELQETLKHLEKTMANLEQLTTRVEKSSGPLLKDTQAALSEARNSMLAAQKALHEMAGVATSVRGLTEENSPLQQNLNRALKESARAARAVRELSESIEQRPESLLRGKGEQQ